MKLDLINIEGLKYELPPKPPNKQIRNYGLPKKKQVWSRHTWYEDFDWSKGWEERIRLPENAKYLQAYAEELDRLYNGEWIFIGGEPVYLNNYMYFFVQWMYLENEYYPEFRDASLYYFRFVEICEKARLCWGHVLIKGRRLGASSMEASIMLLQALIYRNKKQGIISKTGTDAADIFDFVVVSFQNLPVFLQPEIEGSDAPKVTLSIKRQASRVTKDKTQASSRQGLNNLITHRKTALNSFDSGKWFRLLVDEAAKWLEVDINTYVKIAGKTLTTGAMVSGKGAIVSTVNKGDKGGDRFKILWEQSDQSKRNRLGQTTSKFYRLFIAACFGYEGYIDQYGNSVVEKPTPEQTEYLKTVPACPDPTIGALEYIMMQRELLKHDEEGLQEEIRQAPLNWKEVFETAGKKIHFDRKAHEAQLERVKERLLSEGKDPEKGELGRRGMFYELPNGDAAWRDDPEGICYMLQAPKQPNKYNKKVLGDKVYYTPLGTAFGAAGHDPISHAQATLEKGSDSCLIIRRRFDMLEPDNSGMPVFMLLGRLPVKGDLHRQVFLALKYYGVRILGERAPSDWIDYALDKGYEKYLIATELSNKKPVYGANPQSKEGREQHLTEMVESSYTDVEKIWFRRLLTDRLNFDFDNRTDYDAAMADGYACIGIKEPFRKEENKPREKAIFKRGSVHTYSD